MESQNQALVIPRHPRANAPEPRNPVEPPSLRRLLLKKKSVRQRAYGMIGLIKAIRTSLTLMCSVTQPLLLDWLHSHGCSISEGNFVLRQP